MFSHSMTWSHTMTNVHTIAYYLLPTIKFGNRPMARASVGVAQLKHMLVFLILQAKTAVSLCVLVPLWLTIFHHGGTKTQRDTKNFVENVV